MFKERICVVGAGVVGQATGRGFLARGFKVEFVDVKPEVVERLRREGLVAYTPPELESKPLTAAVVFFTVSTPTEAGKINLDYLHKAAGDIGRRLAVSSGYRVIAVRSTVVPGTTEGMVKKELERWSGKKAGRDFGLCMNPEYLREASAEKDFAEPWLVVIGQLDEKSGDELARLYKKFGCPVERVSIKEAEMQKYAHNLFNAAKITFFNEMRRVCEGMGINADNVFPLVAKSAEGMWNPAYGIRDFGPFNGMCLPKDTQAFLAWAAKQGWDMPLLKTTIAVNNTLMEQEKWMEEVAREGVTMQVEGARA